MSVNQNRLDWVDAAKGISIILVVMMHSAYGVGEDLGDIGILHYVIGWATPFRMPEFFLISGLFLTQVIGRPWRLYADRRVVHYIYFYALWVVLQVGFKVGLGTGDVGSALAQIGWAASNPTACCGSSTCWRSTRWSTKLFHALKVPHWAALRARRRADDGPDPDRLRAGRSLRGVLRLLLRRLRLRAAWSSASSIGRSGMRFLPRSALVGFAIVLGYLVFEGGSSTAPARHRHGLCRLPAAAPAARRSPVRWRSASPVACW